MLCAIKKFEKIENKLLYFNGVLPPQSKEFNIYNDFLLSLKKWLIIVKGVIK